MSFKCDHVTMDWILDILTKFDHGSIFTVMVGLIMWKKIAFWVYDIAKGISPMAFKCGYMVTMDRISDVSTFGDPGFHFPGYSGTYSMCNYFILHLVSNFRILVISYFGWICKVTTRINMWNLHITPGFTPCVQNMSKWFHGTLSNLDIWWPWSESCTYQLLVTLAQLSRSQLDLTYESVAVCVHNISKSISPIPFKIG